uniref:transposase n=1 Tax=Corynebacterium propinquum TaxID=43769 RepID=UPI000A46C6A3
TQPICAGKKGNLPPCPGISEEFKRDAVALHENNEDLSLKSASAELGINLASLYSWVKKYGTGKRSRTKALHDKAQVANDS